MAQVRRQENPTVWDTEEGYREPSKKERLGKLRENELDLILQGFTTAKDIDIRYVHRHDIRLTEKDGLPIPDFTPENITFVRAGKKEDHGRGIDFWVWDKDKGWICFDLTTSTDPSVLTKKAQKAQSAGIHILSLRANDLQDATAGKNQSKINYILPRIWVEINKQVIKADNPQGNRNYYVTPATSYSQEYRDKFEKFEERTPIRPSPRTGTKGSPQFVTG